MYKNLSVAKKQVVLSYLLKGASVIVSLLYIPLMLSYLTKSQFGLWVAITSVLQWIRLFDVGIGNGLRHQLATALAFNDNDKSAQLISTAYFVLGGIFCGIWLIFMAINGYIPWQDVLNVSDTNPILLRDIMYVAATALIFTFIFDLVKIIYAAHGNSAAGNIIQLCGSLLSLIGIWLLTLFSKPEQLFPAVLIVAGAPLLVYIFTTIYTYWFKYPEVRPSRKKFDFSGSRDLFGLSAKFFVVQITSTILYTSLPFIITRFYGTEAVAEFHVARSIFNLPAMVIGLFTAPLVPLITREYAKLNFNWIHGAFKKAMLLALGVSAGTGLLILISPWVYELWLGDKISVSYQLSVYVGIYAIVNVLVNPLSSFINAIGKIDILVWLSPIGIVMFIGGCFLFDPWFNNVSAIILALTLTSAIGLIVEPFVLKKYLWR